MSDDDIVLSAQAAKRLKERFEYFLPPHLRALHDAMNAEVISARLVFEDTVGMKLDDNIPSVIIYFDALNGGRGPSGFDQRLLNDVVSVVSGVICVTRFDAEPYRRAIDLAVQSGGVSMLVETVEAHEQAWLDLGKKAPRGAAWVLWSSNVAGNA